MLLHVSRANEYVAPVAKI